jgi:hypothetical protein
MDLSMDHTVQIRSRHQSGQRTLFIKGSTYSSYSSFVPDTLWHWLYHIIAQMSETDFREEKNVSCGYTIHHLCSHARVHGTILGKSQKGDTGLINT